MTDHKDNILNILNLLYKERQKNNEVWKARAYKKVIDILKDYDKPIHTLDDITDIEGIGKNIRLKIKEIIETGTVDEIASMSKEDKDINELIDKLTKISGIGIKKAQSLVEDNNIKSIEDLENHKELLNDKQLIGLKYYKDLLKRIKRDEMDLHYELLKSEIAKFKDSNNSFEIAGSYRRGEKNSGDIDMLITNKNNDNSIFKNLVDNLIKSGYIKETLAYGNKKFMGICKLKYRSYRRIDIMITAPNQYPFALLYFTGSAKFNVIVRNIAISKGLSLNEYGLSYIKKNTNEDTKYIEQTFNTEEDILNYLGLKYIKPIDRIENIDIDKYKL